MGRVTRTAVQVVEPLVCNCSVTHQMDRDGIRNVKLV
jgi:hypothetical protein